MRGCEFFRRLKLGHSLIDGRRVWFFIGRLLSHKRKSRGWSVLGRPALSDPLENRRLLSAFVNVTISASTNEAPLGTPVIFSVTVAPVVNGPTPTGMLTFYDANVVIGTASLSNGTGSLQTSSLALGSHGQISANYGGDANYFSAFSSNDTFENVTQDSISLVVNGPATVAVGENVELLATVTSNFNPTGSVTFLDAGTPIGSDMVGSGGQALIDTTSLPVGADSITADFTDPSGAFAAVNSTPVTVTVTGSTLPVPTVALSDSTNGAAVEVDTPVTFTATVTGPGATPSGTVTFFDGSTPLGSPVPLNAGIAMLVTSALPVGQDQITVQYSGDSNDAPAASPAVTQPVDMPMGTIFIDDPIALYNPPDSLEPYQQTLTATITNTGPADTTFDLSVKQLGSGSVLGPGNVFLSDSSLTIPAGQSMPVTITPSAVSSAGNDVEIDLSSGGMLVASKKMTVISMTIPPDIFAPDTPDQMIDPGVDQGALSPFQDLTGGGFYRIAPGTMTPTPEEILITPDLKPIGQSVTLLVTGQSNTNGTVLIDGKQTEDINDTADIKLTGGIQTAPGAGGNLQLTVDVGGQNTIQSSGFSVAAIPNKVTISKAVNATGVYGGLTLDHGVATQAYGFVTLVQFSSDSGDPLDLFPITVKQQASVLNFDEPFAPGFLNTAKNRYGPAGNTYLNPDTTAITPLISASGGLETDELLYTFNDPRTGATNIPVPNSAFYIVRERIENNFITTYVGAPTAISVDLFTSSPGAGYIYETQTARSVGSQSVVSFPAPGLLGPSQSTGAPIDATTRSATTTANGALFPLAAGPAAQLAIPSQPPADIAAGTPFGLAIQAQDSSGAVDSGFNGTITLRLNKYSGDPTAALGGNITVMAVNGVATFSGLTLNKAGNFSITATAPGLTEQTSALFTVTPGAATSLLIGGPTTNVLTSSPFTVQAAVVDPTGNIDTSFNGTVTLVLTTNPTGATLGGTVSANAVNGLVTFSGVTINKAGSGYVITVAGDGFTAATSPFDVNDDQIAITAQPPATAAVGQSFGLTVQVENASGALDTSYNGDITVALDSNLTGPGVTLQGPVTLQAVNGVATFSGLTMTDPGQYRLTVSGDDAGPVHSQFFEISPVATQLAIAIQPPAMVSAGAGFEVDVAAEDANGNVDTSFAGNVTLTLAANPGGSNLGGTVTVPAVNGIATFTGLTLNNPGNGYILNASATGLTPISTGAVNVLPVGKATRLVFTTQPFPNIEAGSSTSVVVKAEDDFGTVDSSFTGSVTLSEITGTLAGTLTVNAVAGVATFMTVMPEGAGTDQSLTASSAGLVSGLSVPITVTASNATQLVLSGPSQNVLTGAPFGFDVFALDRFGNIDSTYTGAVTLSLKDNPGGSTLGGTRTVNAVAGDATFTGLTLSSAGMGYTLNASASGLTTGTSSTFDVTADQLVVTMSPGETVPLLASPTIIVSAEDGAGTVDTSFNGPVTVSLMDDGTGTATLGGTLTVNAVAGVATFSDLTLDQTGAYALVFMAAGLGGAQSDIFTVTPRVATTITLTASATTVPFDNPTTFTATVSSSTGVMTGAGPVTFFSQGAAIDTFSVQADGVAVLIANAGNSGMRTITASFAGNGNFLPSALSAPVVVTVGPQSTAIPNLGKFIFPATTVAGQPIRTSLPVLVTNTGSSLKGRFTVKLFLDLGMYLGPDAVQLGSAVRTLSLASGKSTTIAFHIRSLPATVPTGPYHFLAEIIDPTGATDVESTAGTITVEAPIITLSAVGGPVKPANIRPGLSGTATVVITDTGNIGAIGTITIVLSPSSDGATPAPGITLAALHRPVHLRLNHPMAFPVHFKVPAALPAGSYQPYFSITLGAAVTTAVGNVFSVS